MGVDAPPAGGRLGPDRLQQGVGACLRAVRAELHGDGRRLDGGRDLPDQPHVGLRIRKRVQPGLADHVLVADIVQRQQFLVSAIPQGPAIAQRHDECQPNPHVLRGAGDRLRVRQQAVHLDGGVDMHHRADPSLQKAAEGERRIQVLVDRGLRIQRDPPQLHRLVAGAERQMVQPTTVVMGVDERRHRQQSAALLPCPDVAGGRHGLDASVRPAERRAELACGMPRLCKQATGLQLAAAHLRRLLSFIRTLGARVSGRQHPIGLV